MGRVPPGLRGDHAGTLPAGLHHAARACFSRRRVRIPFGCGDKQRLLEFCLCRRLNDCRRLSGRDPRRPHRGDQGGERRLRRRAIRLGDALRPPVRPWGDGRLCPARSNLAGDEDGRRRRRTRPRSGQGATTRRARVHGGGQHLDAARVRPHRRALVLGTQHLLPLASTAAHRANRTDGLALARGGARDASVLRVDRPVPARVSRPRDLDLSLSRAADADALADRGRAREPTLHADRDADPLPIILGYIVFVYWIFRGKVREGEGTTDRT